jgi:hypothetical protein
MATMVEKLQNLVQTLFNEKSKVRDIYESQMFSSKTMLEMKQKAYRKIVMKKNEIFDEEINRIQNELKAIERSYAVPEITPDKELLRFKKIEAQIKALPDSDLEQKVKDFLVGKVELLDVPLKPDYINIVVSELRARGQAELAQSIYDHFYKALIGNAPWKADPEYRKLERQLKKLVAYKQFENEIMIIDEEVSKLNPETYYIGEELGLPEIQRPEIAG